MVEPGTRHTVFIRQLVDNLHLHRRQFQIHVIHLGRGNLSRPELKEELVRKFDFLDTQTIFISSFKRKAPFSKGFGIIYDSVDDALIIEQSYATHIYCYILFYLRLIANNVYYFGNYICCETQLKVGSFAYIYSL